MSFQALQAVRTVKDISATARLVLFGLAQYAGADGLCHPSQDTLAEDLGLSERAVRKALAELKAAGVIETARRCRRNGSRTSDLITLKYFTPREAPEADARLTRVRGESPAASGVEADRNRHDMPVVDGAAAGEGAQGPRAGDMCPGVADDGAAYRHDMPVANRHIRSSLPAPYAGPTTFESVRGREQVRESSTLSQSARAPDDDFGGVDELNASAAPDAQACDEWVDLALAIWPASGRKRTNRPAAVAAVAEAAQRAGGLEALTRAVRACAADPDLAKGDYGWPGLQRWLGEARFLAWLPGSGSGAGPVSAPAGAGLRWAGPDEVRARVAAVAGEGAVRSYLDPAGWDAEGRTVLARTGFAAQRLRAAAGPVLLAMGVRLGVMGQDVMGADRGAA